MSSGNHMPPVPPANRSPKGPGDKSDVSKDAAASRTEVDIAEQGHTTNIRLNTTNKGFFQGRRVK